LTTAVGSALAVAAMVACSACGSGSDSITVSDPWARPSPPETDSTAIYVVLTNRTDGANRLVAAKTGRCERTELHRTEISDDGVASMVPAVDGDLMFGPGEELAFEPNALHVMCIGIEEPLVVGESFDVEFTFAVGEPLTVAVAVRQP
jgi:copper(I)-binding protein